MGKYIAAQTGLHPDCWSTVGGSSPGPGVCATNGVRSGIICLAVTGPTFASLGGLERLSLTLGRLIIRA